MEEGKLLTHLPGFKGYIHDVGGPTANFRRPACEKQMQKGACPNRQCLFPQPCKNIRADHAEFVGILRELRALPGVKKVFIRSGIRYDYLLLDKSPAFLRELTEHHVSGQLKVAPEHVSANALSMMGKPGPQVFEEFRRHFEAENRRLGKKQYLVPVSYTHLLGKDRQYPADRIFASRRFEWDLTFIRPPLCSREGKFAR